MRDHEYEDHLNMIKEVEKEDIENFCEKTSKQLMALANRVIALNDTIKLFKQRDTPQTSRSFMAIVKEAKELIMPFSGPNKVNKATAGHRNATQS